jgi:putative molybdopterin biosynthesis protein
MIIFQILVRPLLARMVGSAETEIGNRVEGVLAVKIFSASGRREFMPVHIIADESGKHIAYPVTGGSGAITSYAMADGFIDVPADHKLLDEGESVNVTLLNPELRPANLTIIGSHCIGIDILLNVVRMTDPGFFAKTINVGSMGGLNAINRGEADLAGIHLLDETSGEFNLSYIRRLGLVEKVALIRGYDREQGLVVAKGNPKSITGFEDLPRMDVTFVNRNPGSGTRILTDLNIRNIAERKCQKFEDLKSSIKGYTVEAKSHSAVATAVLQGKADVGVGIRAVTKDLPLDFIPIMNEHFDFLVLRSRLQKDSVKLFLEALRSNEFRQELERKALGINVTPETGALIV